MLFFQVALLAGYAYGHWISGQSGRIQTIGCHWIGSRDTCRLRAPHRRGRFYEINPLVSKNFQERVLFSLRLSQSCRGNPG